MINKIHLMIGIATIVIFAGGCRDSMEESNASSETPLALGHPQLDQSQRERLGIVVTPVRHKLIIAAKSFVGWLELPPASQTVVRSPVTGFVVADPTQAWPTLGQTVEHLSALARVNVFLTSQEISQLVIAKEDNDIQMQQALVTMQLSEAQLNQVTTVREAVAGVRIDQLKEALAHSKVAFKEA